MKKQWIYWQFLMFQIYESLTTHSGHIIYFPKEQLIALRRYGSIQNSDLSDTNQNSFNRT